MLRIIILFFVICFTSSAYAKQEAKPKSHIDILCKNIKLTNDQSTNGAEYVPGVDVHGNTVASADLPTSPSPYLNNPIIIPIEIDLIERYNITGLPSGAILDAKIADLKVYANGNVEYNDQNVTSKIEKLCQDHRQEKDNPVPSTNLKKEKTINDKIEGQYP